MNTPDTEKNLLDPTQPTHTGNQYGGKVIYKDTPDTEWEQEFDGRMTTLSRYGGFYHGNKNGVELFDFDNIKAFIKKERDERDTYWKERVKEYLLNEHIHYSKTDTGLNFSFEDERPYVDSLRLEQFIDNLK